MSSSPSLLADLDESQTDLIKLIGRPWTVNDLANTKGWPVWDFVRRRYAANHREDGATIDTAAEVLASLPSISSPSFHTGSYGLFWRSGSGLPGLQPTDRVGLTIAGLRHLWKSSLVERERERRPDLGQICVNLIRAGADLEVELLEDTDWTKVAEGSLDVRSQLTQRNEPPMEILGQVLQHEFMIIARTTTQFNWSIDYGAGRLERFHGVTKVEDYIELLQSMADADTSVDLVSSPLRLPGTLDHLGLVLARHPAWTHLGPFIKISDFDAATRLLQPPASRAEFTERSSDLWTIISQLGVPQASDDTYTTAKLDPTRKGTINDLQLWLQVELGEDYPTVADALTTIRRIGHVRQGSQHASSSTRTKADCALTALGVTVPVTDWPQAWGAAVAAAAAAFYTIATAVRRLQP